MPDSAYNGRLPETPWEPMPAPTVATRSRRSTGPGSEPTDAARSARSARSGSGRVESTGQRALVAALCALVPTLIVAYLVHLLSGGGSSKSYAGIPLNFKLFEFMALGFPVALLAIALALRWRRLEPFGLTLGFGVVASLSWLGLLFMMQVKTLIPHLPPLPSVPLTVAAAFALAAVLTSPKTSSRGRYACLVAVLLSHVAIVAIVVSIVMA